MHIDDLYLIEEEDPFDSVHYFVFWGATGIIQEEIGGEVFYV